MATNFHEQLRNTDKYYWLERACSNKCDNICKKAHTDRTARWAISTEVVGEIQCCSDQGACTRVDADKNCYSGDADAKKYSYLDAVRVCAQDNKRLCTKAELLSNDAAGCCKSGCSQDAAIVWTSDSQYGLFIRTCIRVQQIRIHNFLSTPPNLCEPWPMPCTQLSVAGLKILRILRAGIAGTSLHAAFMGASAVASKQRARGTTSRRRSRCQRAGMIFRWTSSRSIPGLCRRAVLRDNFVSF